MTTLRDLLNDLVDDSIKSYEDYVHKGNQEEVKKEELINDCIEKIKERLIG